MSRIVFITDQHLCMTSRWDETQRLMAWCEQKFAELRPDVIAFGGDLFDRAPSVEEVRTAAEWIRRLSMIAPVVGVTGNHDPRGLSVFDMVAPAGRVHFADVPEVYTVGGVDVVLLPWPRKAQLLAMLPDASAEQARQIGVEQLLNVLRGLGARTSDRPRCFVGHVQIRGAKVSTGQPLAPGADFELGWEDLGLAQCDAYLLGHIHLPDEVSVGGAPACYGGSFRRTAWGEVEEKIVVVVDFAGGAARMWRDPIPCTAMLHIEAQWCDEHVGLPGDVLVPAGLFFHGGRAALPDVSGAEVRVRYMVDSDHRDAARADAQAFRADLLARGAVSVRLEEEVIASTQARAPEVADARTLADKLLAFWRVRGTTPSDKRIESLLAKAHELESTLGVSAAGGAGALRWEKLRVRNVGPFRGEHELDLAAVTGPLVAITGVNGAGKSTTLELLAGAVYRECPTRGSLASLATARDAMVEVTVVNGSRSRVRQHVDSVSGKGEGAVFDEAGAPLIDSAKVRELDAWVAQHMPAPSVLYAGQFAPQGRRGLLDLKASERKALIAEMLGVQHLDTLAKAARARAEEAKSACAAARARIDELPVVDGAVLAQRVQDASAQVEARTAEARASRSALEAAKAAASDVARAIELYERRQAIVRRLDGLRAEQTSISERALALRQLLAQAGDIRAAVARAAEIDALVREAGRRGAAAGDVAAARADVDSLAAKMANNRRVLEREGEIRAAAAEHSEIAALIERTRVDLVRAESDARAASERHGAASAAATTAESEHTRGIGEEQRWSAAAGDAATARAAAATLPVLQARVAATSAALGETSAEIEAVEALRLDGKDRRIAGLRSGLETIAGNRDADAPVEPWAASTLDADDMLAAELAGAPAVLAELRTRLASARADVDDASKRLADAERVAARLAQAEAAEHALAEARARTRAAAERHEQAMSDERATREDAQAAQARARAIGARVEELGSVLAGLAPTAALLAPLENARARIEELAPQYDSALERLDRAQAALAALPVAEPLLAERASLGRLLARADDLASAPALLAELERQLNTMAASIGAGERDLAAIPDAEPSRPADFEGLEAAVVRAEAAERAAVAALDRAQGDVEAAARAEARRAELGRELARIESELADWVRLGQDLGRDGLQAAEIDAAIPEINEIANDLLHRCHGPRFTVELRTDRLSADGKRTIEALDVRVIDTERGRDALAETYSGGECVIVGEALALALTTVACRGKGERPTLVRDESGAALSPENARAYIAMLRTAASQIGADKVLLVSHSADVQEMCDARVEIADGAFSVST